MKGNSFFDCLIVGAGCAGCTLAKKLAEAGFKVALIERKARNRIGHVWEVALEKAVFGRINIKFPPKKYWEEGPDISRYYVMNMDNHLQIDSSNDDGFFIRHNRFNNHLLGLAEKAGAELRDKHWVSELIIDNTNGSVTGITGNRHTFFGSRQFGMKANVVVDASGIDAVLRRQTPDDFLIKRNIHRQDYAYGWNEVREVSRSQADQLQDALGLAPGMLYTRLGKYRAYVVLHLRKNLTVNLIFGAAYSKGGDNARKMCKRFLEENPYFGKLLYGGGGMIPLRRSIDSMTASGFLCIGDAACQVIPTMGSGVASSMHAADIAARVITDAHNRQNFSREQLWTYNHKYQTKRGAVLASYDIIRRFLQSISSEDMDEVFRAHLITNENFINTFSSNIIEYDVNQILDNIVKVISHISLLPLSLRFLQTLRDSQRVYRLYKNYPETFRQKNFIQWEKNTSELFSHYSTIDTGHG